MNQRDFAVYCAAFIPQDAAVGNVVGSWFNLADYNHIEFILINAAGASGEPPTFTFEQAQDTSGTGAKALNFPQYTLREAADITTVTAQTNVVVSPVANTITPAAGNKQRIVTVEFDAQNLDGTNGYKYCRVRVPDVGATAQLMAAIARLSEMRYDNTMNPLV